MSSWFFQVTVVPTFTVSSAGAKVKLSIVTVGVLGAGGAGVQDEGRSNGDGEADGQGCGELTDIIVEFPSALQRRVDDREALLAAP